MVQRVLVEHPGRTVVWIDDELHGENRFSRWAAGQSQVVPIGPNPRCGLTADDLSIVPLALS